MKTIKSGEVPTWDISNKSLIGFDIVGYIAHTTLNTAFAADVLVLENILVKAELIRRGVSTTICNDNLRTLFAHSVHGKHLFRAISGSQDLVANIQLAAAAGAKEVILSPYVILFPSGINLKGTDVLRISINLPATSFAATVDVATSYIGVDVIEWVGVEYGIPVIRSWGIAANQPSDTINVGDAVVDMKLFNFDKKSYLTANRVVTNMVIQSDKHNRNDSDLELQLKAKLGDMIPAANFETFQCFNLYSGLELNDVVVELQLNQANVTAAKNVMVWSQILATPNSVRKGSEMEAKHNRTNAARLGQRS